MTTFPKTVMLLGSGELGKEVAIAAQRLGCHVIACDRYADAPAMQVADQAEVLTMTDPNALKAVVNKHQPDVLIPEIEALAVDALQALEDNGICVIPTARATAVTMNRDRIRNLAAGELELRTARFAYASECTGAPPCRRAVGLARGRQTGDEFLGKGPKRGSLRCRIRSGLGDRHGWSPGQLGPGDRGGISSF